MDGKFAYQALTNRIGYVGITFNEFHSEQLWKKLRAELMDDMKNPESKMYVPAHAQAMECEVKPPKPAVDTPKPKPKSKRKAKAKAVPKPEEPEEEAADMHGSEELPNEDEDEDVWDPNNDS